MHPAVYSVFQDLLTETPARGPILEVGAVSGKDSLLHLPALGKEGPRIGLNLQGGESDPYTILEGNANQMDQFRDGEFQTVLCNSTLEHDCHFWKTIIEIQRVTAPGGMIVIGVPGYSGMGLQEFIPPGDRFLMGRIIRWLTSRQTRDSLDASTPTLGVHNYPGDYYRFSEQAVREVFMANMLSVTIRQVMIPPRFIARGFKP